ncbi:FecR domain-containing protein [Methylophaga thalassica]|uniref:FecR domain-containing protein n=1 Tax=Methylophaga aminisulfidivorans TaxID=230105 RepID=UPI003A8D5641
MSSGNEDIFISEKVIEEAADWLVRLESSEDLSRQELLAFERWRNASPENKAAWAKAETFTNKLHSLPPRLTMSSLLRPTDPDKRASLGKLFLMLMTIPGGWAAWKYTVSKGESSQYQTATGQQITIKLDDGTQVSLNTQTTVDVYFDNKQRALFLREGEIYIETAKDAPDKNRPFFVISPEGTLQALGTRFNVRLLSGKTQVSVYEGAVEVTPKQIKHESLIIKQGKGTRFTEKSFDAIDTLSATKAMWQIGMLVADNMQLVDFISELNRYFKGTLQCDPNIANMKIAGAFPVTNTQKSLNMLVDTYPVTIVSKNGRYRVIALQK